MRVAFITHYTELYGANRSLLNLIDGLVPLGVRPFAIVPREGDITSALRERGIPILVTPHQQWSGVVYPGGSLYRKFVKYLKWRKAVLRRLKTNLLIMPSIVRQLKHWQIDIIYTNSSVIPLGAMVALWMKKPHVWHLREFGDLDYNLTLDWGKSLFNYFLHRADALICISEVIRSYYSRGIDKGKSHVVYNGVATRAEMDSFHGEANALPHGNNKFVFALVGVIHPGKGQETAIKALALLQESFPESEIIIAGGGADTKPLKELAKSCGVSDKVVFWGYAENPYDVYARANAVLMCSKNEAMGRVTVEAMAAGKPVIGYNAGGTTELIINEFNGLLYKGGEKELSSCMRRLAERPAWAREMGENGWKTARGKYSVEVYAGRIYEILSAIIKKKADK